MQAQRKDFLVTSKAINQLPNRFVVHRNKEPVSLVNPAVAGAHGDPSNQCSLLDALRICEQIGGTGIGFSVPKNYVVVDFDSAIDDQDNIHSWALAVLSKIPDTLIEYSPSGHGLHAYLSLTDAAHDYIMSVDKATSIANGKVEFLRMGFYSTITGNRLEKFPDKLAELDSLGAQQLFDRIKQTARSCPSVIPVEKFDETIYKATEEDVKSWRAQIMTGAALHQPTFMYAWWSAYNFRDKNETEAELHELYNKCKTKDDRWQDRKRKINSIVARCFRKAVEYHKIVEERRLVIANLTEEGAVKQVKNSSKNFLYTSAAGWLVYNDYVYETITEYQARELLHQCYADYYADAYRHALDAKTQTAIHKFVQSCRSNKFRTAIELFARGVLVGNYDNFDLDPSILNCRNGVLDLRTGVLLKHDPSFMLINMANVNYYKKTDTPCFDKFMDELTCYNEELKEFLLCCLGYSLTGETAEQKFFVLYGAGGNGKTTLMNIIRDIIGSATHVVDHATFVYKRYFSTIRSESLLMADKTDIGNDLAGVAKARFVLATEIGDRRIKDERLKAMVGGDTIQVRFLFREYFQMTPQFKLWLQTNQRPKVRGNDEGIWRRAIMIPCLGDFRKNPDNRLGDKLFEEREAIFYKLVQYAMKWYRDRLPTPPKAVIEETQEWREESDAVARFLRECVSKVAGYKTSNGEIWKAWINWCKDNNEREGTSNEFLKRVREAGWEAGKYSIKGTSQRGYDNMKLEIDDDVEVEF